MLGTRPVTPPSVEMMLHTGAAVEFKEIPYLY